MKYIKELNSKDELISQLYPNKYYMLHYYNENPIYFHITKKYNKDNKEIFIGDCFFTKNDNKNTSKYIFLKNVNLEILTFNYKIYDLEEMTNFVYLDKYDNVTNTAIYFMDIYSKFDDAEFFKNKDGSSYLLKSIMQNKERRCIFSKNLNYYEKYFITTNNSFELDCIIDYSENNFVYDNDCSIRITKDIFFKSANNFKKSFIKN